MAVRSSSSSSNYDVYLSFQGIDTRYGFTGHLYKALCDRGIHTFIDDEELQWGNDITPALFEAIQRSNIDIVVLSESYASSSLCLEELAYILDYAKSKGLWVIPVFYKVDPSHVRHQKGSYGEALAKHERRFPDKLQKWTEALCQVANLSGYHFNDGDRYEYKFIESIVGSVSAKINHPARLHVGDYLVGLESRVKEVMELMDVGSDDGVHMVGIHGMGGIGKSTLARAVYNYLIPLNFDSLCFLENVSENSNKQGLQHLQRILLSETVAGKNINITSVKQGISIIQHRLCRKKVLLLLDDVDKLEQLEAIAGKPDWFGPGSRIIITTRDQQLLSRHGVNRTYEVKGLNRNDALQLLSWKAFETENFDASYEDVLKHIVTYFSGHPLALEQIGSELFRRDLKQWENAVKRLETFIDYRTRMHKKHEVSSDILAEEEKSGDHQQKKQKVSSDIFAEEEKSGDHMQKKHKVSFDVSAKEEKSGDHQQKKQKVSSESCLIDEYEYEFIERIVERVCREINHTPSHVGYPVGLESKVLKVRKLLDVGCDDIIMIGIFGTGGVGKSTLTREVYNSIADHFDASCFIENVREKSKKHGLQRLQSILFFKILGEDINVTSVQQESSIIHRRLQRKKVLLILDDVDKHMLQAVVESRYWFGPGSKVIITTQHEQLLASHGIKRTYEVKKLHEKDALQLLQWKAFKTQYFDPRYEELLNRAVTYASGLPLVLEIIGSNLFGKSVEEWKSAIHQFEKSPNDPIHEILKASFDTLEEKTRSIFLDMACYFNGYELAEIQYILHAHYGHSVKDDIDILVNKSLVKLSHGTKPCYDTMTLHDLVKDMGKEIEQQESLTESSERRRLWLLEDIREVLEYNTGTSQIEMICLDFSIFHEEKKVEWDGKAFQNIQNLKTIIIRNVNFSKGPEHLPNSLRVLEWWRYPSNRLPSDFHPKELAICKLPYSHILPTELRDLWKKFPNLKVLEISSANV